NREYTLPAFWLHSQLQIFINLFYVAFAKHYLNTTENYPKLDRAIQIVSFTLLFFFIVTTITVFNQDFYLHIQMMNLHRYFFSSIYDDVSSLSIYVLLYIDCIYLSYCFC